MTRARTLLTAALLALAPAQVQAQGSLNLETDTPLQVTAPLRLTLPTAPGTVTRYTLDGSAPTPRSPQYTAPLTLSAPAPGPGPMSRVPTTLPGAPRPWVAPTGALPRLVVVRAQTFRGDTPAGPILTRSYALGPLGGSADLPVVSLVLDPAGFTGTARGIYVPGAGSTPETANFVGRGRDWERPVHFEWFEYGQRVLAQDAGVRVSGNQSRFLPQKSLRLYARSEYSQGNFRFAPFADAGGPERFNRLRLRTSGQDQSWSRFRDCLIHDLLRPTGLDVQHCQPARVFVNGEYWGLHNLREEPDADYLAERHGLRASDVAILSAFGNVEEGNPGDDASFWELMRLMQTGAGPAEVERLLDLENTFTYLAAQLFIAGDDWPENNVHPWRHKGTPGEGAADGRWRWLFVDADESYNDPEFPALRRLLGRDEANPVDANAPVVVAFRYIVSQPALRARFLAHLEEELTTTFDPDRAFARIEHYRALLAPEIPLTVARWRQPETVARWEFEVSVLRDFAETRAPILRRSLAQELPRN